MIESKNDASKNLEKALQALETNMEETSLENPNQLTNPYRRWKDGYMEGNGYIVTWCLGHLVELAQPGDYCEAWKNWTYESLLMIPKTWRYELKAEIEKQYIRSRRPVSGKSESQRQTNRTEEMAGRG